MICGPNGPNGQGCGEVLKLDLNPTKLEVLAHFGHPSIKIELEEIHFESIFRSVGNFIAGYFPFEEKIATFYTKPLVTEYDLPPDAYWIKQVKWDPAVTRIGDIFGAESFLFCFADGFKILNSDDTLIDISEWKDNFKCKTPYGNKKLILNRHEIDQNLIKVEHECGSIICTPNHPLKINNINELDDWLSADECSIGTKLVTEKGLSEVTNIDLECDHGYTTTVYVPGAHCFYGCHEGDPVLVH